MIIDRIFESMSEADALNCFLTETVEMSEIDPEVSIWLSVLYTSSGNRLRIAPIYNSLFNQNLQTFIFSRKTLIDLYAQDAKNANITINDKQYTKFLFEFCANPMFEVLRVPTNNKAGVYKLIDPDLVSILHKNFSSKFFAAQEKFAVQYYDDHGKNKANKPVKETKLITIKKQDIIDRVQKKLDLMLGDK